MKLKKLAICTPSRDGMFPINYVSTQEGILKNIPEGWDVQYSLVRGTSDIVNARNSFINKWYYETDADAMLFLDSDMGFKHASLKKLLDASEIEGVDFICGNYVKKDLRIPNLLSCASKWDGEIDIKELLSASGSYVSEGKHILYEEGEYDGLCEIDGVGMGCFLITRASGHKIFKWAEVNMEKTEFTTFGKPISGYPVFNSISNSKGNYGEDYSFCMRVKEAGLRIFFDPSISLTHTGNYDFYGKFADALAFFKKEKLSEVDMSPNNDIDNEVVQLKK